MTQRSCWCWIERKLKAEEAVATWTRPSLEAAAMPAPISRAGAAGTEAAHLEAPDWAAVGSKVVTAAPVQQRGSEVLLSEAGG